jgi:pimeloyl-ACP methyl ester carboxylesterase
MLVWTAGGLASVAVVGAVGVDLISRGVLPGRRVLDALDGACSVPHPTAVFSGAGTTRSDSFHSAARGRVVDYTIGFPPGYQPGQALPLVVALHAYGVDHRQALSSIGIGRAPALEVDGKPLPPFAVVAADGGGGYWHAHPGDDPMRMVVDELLPRCQALGLGRAPQPVGLIGISMGGYGALLLAEQQRERFRAVAAISPAIWRTYREAQVANRAAFDSAADFTANDVIAAAARLDGTPVQVASGSDDPFHPGVEAFERAAPATVAVTISKGCHTGSFFDAHVPPSLAFLAQHLA